MLIDFYVHRKQKITEESFKGYEAMSPQFAEEQRLANQELIKNPPSYYILNDYSDIYMYIFHTLRMELKINSIKEMQEMNLDDILYASHYISETHRIKELLEKEWQAKQKS